MRVTVSRGVGWLIAVMCALTFIAFRTPSRNIVASDGTVTSAVATSTAVAFDSVVVASSLALRLESFGVSRSLAIEASTQLLRDSARVRFATVSQPPVTRATAAMRYRLADERQPRPPSIT